MNQHDSGPFRRRQLLIGVAAAGLTLVAVGFVSRYALLTVMVEGLWGAAVLLPPALVGLWLVPLFRLGPMPLRWHLLLGAALGLGATSLLVLLLGLAGFLQRGLWIGILAVFFVAGSLRLRTLLANNSAPPSASPGAGAMRYLCLLAGPFLVLSLLAATTAPGFIWQEEGFGYDVLEYHLQLPREYNDAGRIEYLPHNVYAAFPANVEMLYLLAMILHGEVRDAGVTANMIHWMMGLLMVWAAWVAAREWSSQAAVVSGVALATCGWFVYLSGLAYVEHGMLFYGLVATGTLLQAWNRRGGDGPTVPTHARRWIALAGVIAGLACGCKYTAVAMIALPLGVAVLLLPRPQRSSRGGSAGLFALAVLLTVSPWLINNQVMSGNPVFPLANTLFDASPSGWGEEETQSWDRGHSIPDERRTLSVRLSALWNRVLWDPHSRFGPVMILLAIVGLAGRRRDRVDGLLLIVAAIQLMVWLFATHLFARFAVVLLIPLALLCGRAAIAEGAWRRWAVAGAVVAGAVWNFSFAYRMARAELPGDAPASLIYEGVLPGYEYFAVVNRALLPSDRVLLVADAKAFYFARPVDYCVVFNRSPFLTVVQDSTTEREVWDWLRSKGYRYVLVNWAEVRRLASTYGFSPRVEPQRLARVFDRLTASGLLRRQSFEHPAGGSRYVDLYEVAR